MLTDNRYLAHNVRELVTFSLCYCPISLFVSFRLEGDDHWAQEGRSKIPIPVIVLSTGIFLVLLAYQTYHPLTEGIGILAQKPAFANGHQLGIAYLLAAHFFEHFLDTLFFTPVAGFMFTFGSRVKA